MWLNPYLAVAKDTTSIEKANTKPSGSMEHKSFG
jgi:hypothetical protein